MSKKPPFVDPPDGEDDDMLAALTAPRTAVPRPAQPPPPVRPAPAIAPNPPVRREAEPARAPVGESPSGGGAKKPKPPKVRTTRPTLYLPDDQLLWIKRLLAERQIQDLPANYTALFLYALHKVYPGGPNSDQWR
jgi:hypothetical protein